MNLTTIVADLVARHGESTIDRLQAECDGHTPKQVVNAKNNAIRLGLIVTVKRGRNGNRFKPSVSSVYAPAPGNEKVSMRVSSVFDLGRMWQSSQDGP